MGFRITWNETNATEDGQRIYRSTSTMDPQNMPAALAELAADVVSYDDGNVTEGLTYYYRVSAYIGANERISDELQITAI